MHRRRTSLSLLLLLLVPALAAAQAPRTIALDDLHAIRAVSGLAVSPDGRHAVYVVREVDREKDRRVASLWRVPVEGGTPERLVHGASNLSSPSFSPDGRYLAFVTTRDLAGFGIPKPAADRSQVFVLPTSGGEAFPITAVAAGVSSYAWDPDGRRLVVGARDDRPETPEEAAAPPIVVTRLQHKRDGSGFLDNRRTHLHLLSVEEALASRGHRHAAVRQLTEGPHDHSSAEWSPDGRHIVFASNRTEDPDDNNNSDVWVLDVGTRQVRQVTTDPGSDGRAAWSPDGRWIAYVHTPADPPVYAGSRLMVVPAEGGTPRNLTERLDRTVSSRPRWAPDSSSIYVTVDDDGRSPLLRVSLDGRVVRAVEGDVGDVEIARDRFVALMATPSRPTEVYAIPDGGGAPVELSRANADLFASLRFNTPEEIRYRSADGTPIHGWVIRPPEFRSGARYPLLLRIHGGPVAQYTDSFSFEFQYLASLGYVVVFTNPRGSTGYGEAFSRAIFADWGNRDYEDVVAGVEHVIAKGYADPQKLGVGGWSYGGILTNYVITKTARFAAAISGAGSSDMFSSFGVDDVRLWWLNELGAPWENVDLYRRLSPIYDVAKVTTPTLFVVGDQDYRVPLPQSEQFYVALRTLGRPTGMIIYPGQAHGITRPSYQTDRLRRYGLWYDKYVKGLDVDPMFETWEPVKKAPPEGDDRGAMSTSRVVPPSGGRLEVYSGARISRPHQTGRCAMTVPVSLTVNGRAERHVVEPRLLLVHFLRDILGLTGTKIGCDTSQCGSCTVLVDGAAVKACTCLTVQADGAKVTTIEGLAPSPGSLHPLQESFWTKHGLQCGFCTPGMIFAAGELLRTNPNPTPEQIRHGLEGNLCRCTGYENIVRAVQDAAAVMGSRR